MSRNGLSRKNVMEFVNQMNFISQSFFQLESDADLCTCDRPSIEVIKTYEYCDLCYDDGCNCGKEFKYQAQELPIWGTLFGFKNTFDDDWALKYAEEINEIGFYIYQDNEGSIWLGIDSAGHDFYETYWNKLYALYYGVEVENLAI